MFVYLLPQKNVTCETGDVKDLIIVVDDDRYLFERLKSTLDTQR